MRKLLTATFGAMLLLSVLAAARPASAAEKKAEKKPLVVVSFGGYEQLLSNAKVVGELAGRPALAEMLDGAVTMVTAGKGFAGLDKARPWGMAVYAGENDDYPLSAFIPVTDLKQLVAVVPPGPKAPTGPDADGVYEIEGKDGKPAYMVQKGTWAVLADSRDGLKSLPGDPATLLHGMNKKYFLAVRADLKNLPSEKRDQFINQVKMLLDLAMMKKSGESDEQFDLRTRMAKASFQQLQNFTNDLDGLMLGLAIDPHTRAINLDLELTAVPGTKTAEKMAGAANARTAFAGFLMPGAALTMISAATHSDAEVAEAKEMLTAFRKYAAQAIDDKEDLGKERQDLLKKCTSDVMDVMNGTLDSKKSDSGIAVLLDGKPTLVAGIAVADGAKLEKAIKQLLGDPKVSGLVKLDADKHAGVNFHVATLPIPSEQAAAVLGDQVEIVVGCGKNAVYLGAGKDALKTLKHAIDASQKTPNMSVPAMQLVVGGSPIAKFISQVAPDEAKAKAAKIAELLAKTPGKDHVTVTVSAVPNGVNMRLSFDEGISKAIIASATMTASETSSDN